MDIQKMHLYSSVAGHGRFTLAAGGVIVDKQHVLLILEGADDFWKFPGGKVMIHEDLKSAAKREIAEEVSLSVMFSGEPFFYLLERDTDPKHHLLLTHFFTSDFSGDLSFQEPVTDAQWFSIDKLPKNIAPNVQVALDFFIS